MPRQLRRVSGIPRGAGEDLHRAADPGSRSPAAESGENQANQFLSEKTEALMIIKYNTDRSRWEVYPAQPRIRAGEPQPSFVSGSFEACAAYVARVEARA